MSRGVVTGKILSAALAIHRLTKRFCYLKNFLKRGYNENTYALLHRVVNSQNSKFWNLKLFHFHILGYILMEESFGWVGGWTESVEIVTAVNVLKH